MAKRNSVAPAATVPCAHCPWRTANHGKKHSLGWYTLKNLRRLWAGLRSGKAPGMTCHPTDPDNIVPQGAPAVPEGTQTRECAGALILQGREMKRFEAACAEADKAGKVDGIARYKNAHPKGMTRDGLTVFCERVMFAGVPLVGGPGIAVDLDCAGVSHPDLVAWEGKA